MTVSLRNSQSSSTHYHRKIPTDNWIEILGYLNSKDTGNLRLANQEFNSLTTHQKIQEFLLKQHFPLYISNYPKDSPAELEYLRARMTIAPTTNITFTALTNPRSQDLSIRTYHINQNGIELYGYIDPNLPQNISLVFTDLKTKRLLRTFKASFKLPFEESSIEKIHLSNNNSHLFILFKNPIDIDNSIIVLWKVLNKNLTNFSLEKRFYGSQPEFSKNGKMLGFLNSNSELVLVDLVTNQEHAGPCCDFFKWNPQKNLILLIKDLTYQIWDVETNQISLDSELSLPEEGPPRIQVSLSPEKLISWSPDGTKIGQVSEKALSIIDLKTKTLKRRAIELDDHGIFLFSPNGTKLLAIDYENLQIFDATSLNLLTSSSLKYPSLIDAQWSPDGSKIIYLCEPVTTSDDSNLEIRICDLALTPEYRMDMASIISEQWTRHALTITQTLPKFIQHVIHELPANDQISQKTIDYVNSKYQKQIQKIRNALNQASQATESITNV